MNKTKVVAITGPTATGKTAFGIDLAKRFNGEIISCDSMQVYQGLPIGTAQPTAEEQCQIPHHLINFHKVSENFCVSDYVKLAGECIDEIANRHKLPILVGGTGLYARSLLQGSSFEETHTDETLRNCLYNEAQDQGNEALYKRLVEMDPQAAEKIHPNNLKRVVRALEYNQLMGKQFSQQEIFNKKACYDYIMICLTYRDRDQLYRQIESRVDFMLNQGLLDEAKEFYHFCLTCEKTPTAAQAIGYKELFPYFSREITLVDAIANLKKATRHYAKRQMTWFRRESAVTFLYLDEYRDRSDAVKACISLVEQFKLR